MVRFSGDQKTMEVREEDLQFCFTDKTGAQNVQSMEDLTSVHETFYYQWDDKKLYKSSVISVNGKYLNK